MDIVQTLTGKKILIVSPHFDDAVLSCGQLMYALKDKADITVVNVFTKGHRGPYTLSAAKFLKSSGHKNGEGLFKARAKEDKHVLTKLNVKQINLGFIDALFRKNSKQNFLSELLPELNHIYPLYRFNVLGRHIHKKDTTLKRLIQALKKLKANDSVILVPCSIGSHIDHVVAKKACEQVFTNIILYSDFPYNVRNNRYFPEGDKYTGMFLRPDMQVKSDLIKLYNTQFSGLFSQNIVPNHDEIYFVPKQSYITKAYTSLDPAFMAEWENLWLKSKTANYTNTPAWFKSVLETFGFKDFTIIAVYKNNVLCGVCPLIKDKVYGVHVYTLPPADFVCGSPFLTQNTDDDTNTILCEALLKLDKVFFKNIPIELLEHIRAMGKVVLFSQNALNYYMYLQADSNGDLLLPNRPDLTKKAKNKQNNFSLRVYTGNNTRMLDVIFDINARSRKHMRGFNIFTDPAIKNFHKKLAKNLGEYLRLNILYFDNTPIAYELGFKIESKYFGNQLSFVENYKKYAPGKLLVAMLIQSLWEQNVTYFDLGSGDNSLKQCFTNQYRQLYSIIISKTPIVRLYVHALARLEHQVYLNITKHTKLYFLYRKFKKILGI